uniref:exodeoxyribonuclease III n=1 Tax=Neogobius melanostomus TaxID=47308 RepID=A0A8C6S5U7_9GOBI
MMKKPISSKTINSIKLISWNIKGISNKVKRYKVLSHLRSLSCDVAMLQEVHVKETEVMKLRQRWVGQVFSSPGNGAAKGVSILISKRMSFRILEQIIDPDGRYLIISGYLHNQKCTLVNIYAQNTGQIDFLSSLTVLLAKFAAITAFLSSSPFPSDKVKPTIHYLNKSKTFTVICMKHESQLTNSTL